MFFLSVLFLIVAVIFSQKYYYENNIKLAMVWAGIVGWHIHALLF